MASMGADSHNLSPLDIAQYSKGDFREVVIREVKSEQCSGLLWEHCIMVSTITLLSAFLAKINPKLRQMQDL